MPVAAEPVSVPIPIRAHSLTQQIDAVTAGIESVSLDDRYKTLKEQLLLRRQRQERRLRSMERMLNDYKTTGREVTDRIDRELAEHRRDLDGLQKRIDNRFVPAHQLANLALARLFLGSVFEREDWSTAGAELVMKLWRDDGLDLNDLVIAFNTVSSLDFPEDGHPSDLSPQTFNDIPKLLDWHLDTMPLKNGQDRRTALVTLAVVVRCMSVPPLSFEGARFWRRFKALDFTHPEISIPPHMSANGHSNGLGIGLQFGGHSRA